MCRLLCIGVLLGSLGSCAGGALQPQLLLEARAVSRARSTAEHRDQRRHYTLSAAISLPVDAHALAAAQTGLRDAALPDALGFSPDAELNACSGAHAALCAWAGAAEDATWAALLAETWVGP